MNYMSNSILAYIPQSTVGKTVLKQILQFQSSLKMRIFILHILKQPSSLFSGFQSKKNETITSKAKQKLIDLIEQTTSETLRDEYIPRIQTGETVSTLIKESKKGGYDFLALDKNESGLKKTEINKLINRSHCPVLLTNKNFPFKKVKQIIIPIDISQTTKKRLFWATFFAKKFNAKIKIVSALNIDINETKSLARRNADKLKTMLQERGIECEVKILKMYSMKHKVILDYIREEHPEMVIIRTHQESLFADRRIGQFVSEIVHGCEVPVFTVGNATLPLEETGDL
ncbi:MAG: universal stress protein [Prolixibacteraceae bacterium]|nr:universal stress protein [Prolixibacteraceae bacterium]